MAAGPDSGLASEAPNFSPILSVWKTGAFTTPAEGLGVKWREVLHSARDPEGYLELVSELPSETAMHPGELLKWPLVSVTSLLGHSATPAECLVKFMAVQMGIGGRGSSLATRAMVAALWGPVGRCVCILSQRPCSVLA